MWVCLRLVGCEIMGCVRGHVGAEPRSVVLTMHYFSRTNGHDPSHPRAIRRTPTQSANISGEELPPSSSSSSSPDCRTPLSCLRTGCQRGFFVGPGRSLLDMLVTGFPVGLFRNIRFLPALGRLPLPLCGVVTSLRVLVIQIPFELQ